MYSLSTSMLVRLGSEPRNKGTAIKLGCTLISKLYDCLLETKIIHLGHEGTIIKPQDNGRSQADTSMSATFRYTFVSRCSEPSEAPTSLSAGLGPHAQGVVVEKLPGLSAEGNLCAALDHQCAGRAAGSHQGRHFLSPTGALGSQGNHSHQQEKTRDLFVHTGTMPSPTAVLILFRDMSSVPDPMEQHHA